MSGVFMEQEDFIRAKDAEICALREELHLIRLDNEAKDREIELLHDAARKATKENLEMRKQLQAWADEADAEIQLAKLRRVELEAMEL
jgi:hypothetical protein